MRKPLAYVAIVSLVCVLGSGAPAHAKGLMLQELTVTGPGLEQPLELDWRDSFVRRTRSAGSNAAIRGLFRQSHGFRPDFGLLGARYELTYRFGGIPGLELFDGESFAVRQFLYPYAPGGPIAYTPDQQVDWPHNFAPGFGPDWEQFPVRFLDRLEGHGLPPEPLPPVAVAPAADDGPPIGVLAAFSIALLALLRIRPRLGTIDGLRPARV